MIENDPGLWISRFGEAKRDNPTFVSWCVWLKDLTGEQFAVGINKVITGSVKFFSCAEFYQMCGGKPLKSEGPQYGEKFVRIEDGRTPEERCATAKPWIKKIRDELSRL